MLQSRRAPTEDYKHNKKPDKNSPVILYNPTANPKKLLIPPPTIKYNYKEGRALRFKAFDYKHNINYNTIYRNRHKITTFNPTPNIINPPKYI